MKKIAIYVSGNGDAAHKVASLFNEGNRIKVELVISGGDTVGALSRIEELGIPVIAADGVMLADGASGLADILRDKEIELLAVDSPAGELPAAVAEAFADKMVVLTGVDESPREVVAALRRLEDDAMTTPPPVNVTSSPKTVDEEWAEALKIKFEPAKERTTPPPVPGSERATVPVEGLQGRPQPVQAPMPSTYLIWSVLTTVFCCFIPGIVAIIFSSQVSSRYFAGDYEGAKRASDRAQIWIIVSFVLGVLSATLYLPIMLFT